MTLTELPLAGNAAIFAVAAGVVWLAGTRLSRLADELAERTNLGRVFVGALVVAMVTTLPELATSLGAAGVGDARLATNGILGALALHTVMLVVVDASLRGSALTVFAARSEHLLQGLVLLLLLGGLVCALAFPGALVLGHVGIGPVVLAAGYVVAIRLLWGYQDADRWRPVDLPDVPTRQEADDAVESDAASGSLRALVLPLVGAAIVVLAGGVTVSLAADALSVQTGLGGSVVGVTLVALATALPDLSTTLGAVRIGAHSMAVANVFGGNALMLAILLPADLVYTDGPLLAATDATSVLAAGTGIAVTATYLIGIVERRDATILRLGVDSVAVLVIYAAAMAGILFLSLG